jgi:transketolase
MDETCDKPMILPTRRQKGWGVSWLANEEGWHGKPLPADKAEEAIRELGGPRDLVVTPPAPGVWEPPAPTPAPNGAAEPAYDGPVATRKAFGDALAWLVGERPGIVALDGEVGNSTYTEDVEKVAPQHFVQLYIAEQCMVGAQTGMQAMGKTAFAATFGAFLTRAYDQIRMGAVSRADLRLCGSHAGVSIGEDGPSQMGLEDLASMPSAAASRVAI